MIKGIAGAVIAGVSFLLVLIVGCAGCTTIGPGNVGIVISKTGASRGVQDVTVKTGWAFVNPITTEVIEYPTFMQTVKWTKSATEGSSPNDESITFTSWRPRRMPRRTSSATNHSPRRSSNGWRSRSGTGTGHRSKGRGAGC